MTKIPESEKSYSQALRVVVQRLRHDRVQIAVQRSPGPHQYWILSLDAAEELAARLLEAAGGDESYESAPIGFASPDS